MGLMGVVVLSVWSLDFQMSYGDFNCEQHGVAHGDDLGFFEGDSEIQVSTNCWEKHGLYA